MRSGREKEMSLIGMEKQRKTDHLIIDLIES